MDAFFRNREILEIRSFLNVIGRSLLPIKAAPMDVVRVCHCYYAPSNISFQTTTHPNEEVDNMINIEHQIYCDNPPNIHHLVLKYTRCIVQEVSWTPADNLRLVLHQSVPRMKALTLHYVLRINNGEYMDSQTVTFRFDGLSSEYKQILNPHAQHLSTTKKSVQLNLIKDLVFKADQFSMDLFTKTLRVKYEDGKQFQDFVPIRKMVTRMKCQWTLSSKSKDDLVVSNAFNGNGWCLVWNAGEWELRLLCLPRGVRSVTVKLAFQCTVNKKKNRRKDKQRTFLKQITSIFSYYSNTFSWESETDAMEISVDIFKMQDMDYLPIPREQWDWFGMESQRKWSTFVLSRQT